MTVIEAPATVPRRARAAVTVLFVVMGIAIGGWSARVPDVRHAVGLGDAGWGLANVATNVGEVVSLGIVAVLIGRVNTRLLALIGAAVILVNAPLLASASTVAALLVGLAVWGFAANLLSTPMNAQAVEVQRAYGRPILSTFHAGFSVGMLAGGLLGTVAAGAGITPAAQMAGTSAGMGVLLLATARHLPDTERADRRAGAKRRFTPQLVLLAAVAFLAAFTEMAGAQWSALYATGTLHAGAAVGAATYTCLSLSSVAARLGGDRLAGRVGRVRFVRWSAFVAAAGLAFALLVPHPAAAMAGFGLLGLGMACVTPTVLGFAGEQPGLTAGEGVSVVVMGQWPGYLVAAPLIGALAGAVDLRFALAAVVLVALSITVLIGRVRTAERSPEHPSSTP
ncbi:MFS transporter [Dactylosporangium siamense]|uniref:MFS transporter n=1 Tax=Dactylosporangium siamense TaxID=685454 RepID=A0A919UFG9_9ACTN|nr:MFS transporter [Dactylosporangium siamense]GIG50156.1 MFS transporter [Dactylosporangium siamense]